jgi:hypothetical protein
MFGHLSEADLVDVLEGTASAKSRAHAGDCPRCSEGLASAREGLALASGGAVPEPSPLYWETFRRGVERRMSAPQRSWPRFLVPLAAAAALAFVVLFPAGRGLLGPGPTPSLAPALPSWSALPPVEEDGDLEVLAAVVESQPDTAMAILVPPAVVEEELYGLSEAEGRALLEALGRSGRGGDL